MKKVAGYVRVSTPQQKEEESHIRQKEQLEDWADSQDEEIELEIFQDIAISGQNPEREDYQELMNRLEEFDAIVVRELSRLGRNTLQILEDLNEITREHDLEFISLKENIDTETAMGKHFLRTIASINQLKSDLARERTKEMYQKYQDEGKKWGRPQKLSEDMIVNQILPDREKGLSYNSLAKLYRDKTEDGKLSPATVRKYIQEYGEEGKHYGPGFKEDDN